MAKWTEYHIKHSWKAKLPANRAVLSNSRFQCSFIVANSKLLLSYRISLVKVKALKILLFVFFAGMLYIFDYGKALCFLARNCKIYCCPVPQNLKLFWRIHKFSFGVKKTTKPFTPHLFRSSLPYHCSSYLKHCFSVYQSQLSSFSFTFLKKKN